jgi:protein disulfide-isomerase
VYGQAPGVQWRHDIEAAKAEAAHTGRLVVVHFWTPTCGPCLRLDSTVFNQPVVGSSIESRFVPVKLNAEEVPAIAQSFAIIEVPTDVIITPDGQVLGKFVSPSTPTAYVSELMKVANQFQARPGTAFQQAVASAPVGAATFNAAYAGLNIGQAAPTVTPTNVTAQRPAPALESATGATAVPPVLGDRYAQVAQQADINNYAAYQPPTAPPGASAALGQDRYGMQPAPSTAVQQPPSDPTQSIAQPIAAQMTNPYVSLPPQLSPAADIATTQPVGAATSAIANAAANHQPPVASSAAGTGVARQEQLPPGSPPLAFEGFCPVSMKKHWRWIPGDTRWGAVHLGRTYLFAGPAEQQEFLATPNTYAPALSGADAVLAVDQRQMIDGRRDFSIEYQGQFFLFSSEDSLQRFQSNPQYYSAGVRQAMAAQQGPVRR